jgi:hypothetical protein
LTLNRSDPQAARDQTVKPPVDDARKAMERALVLKEEADQSVHRSIKESLVSFDFQGH